MIKVLARNLDFNSFSVGRASHVLAEYSKRLGTTKAGRRHVLVSESPIQLFQVAPAGIFFWEKSSSFGIWSQQMHLSCSLVQRRERSGAASSLIPAVLSIFLTGRQPPTQNAKLDHFV